MPYWFCDDKCDVEDSDKNWHVEKEDHLHCMTYEKCHIHPSLVLVLAMFAVGKTCNNKKGNAF